MSIGGIMRTSVSGMNAQANRLSAVSENIANANTTGYKRNTTEFSSMVLASGPGQFNSGVVESQTRQLISQQGGISYTTNASSSQAIDLAIQGKGFLIVGDGAGGSFLTRAGSFVKNGNGDLVNAAGFVLQGYPLPMGDTNSVANGFAGLENVNLNAATLRVKPTDLGLLTVNLDKRSPQVPTLVAGTGTTATNASRTQADVFATSGTIAAGDTLDFTVTVNGTAHVVSVAAADDGTGTGTFAITATNVAAAVNALAAGSASVGADGRLVLTTPTAGTAGSVALSGVTLNAADTAAKVAGLVDFSAVAGVNAVPAAFAGTLPSLNGPDAKPTSKESLVVYDKTGKAVTLDIYMTKTGPDAWEYAVYDRSSAGSGATAPFPYASGPVTTGPMSFDADGKLATPASFSIDVQIPDGELMKLSLEGTTQLDSVFDTLAAGANGNPPEAVQQVKIGKDGIVSAVFKSGTEVPLYKVPLALVESPDNLTSLSGNVYSAGVESGTVLVGFGGSSGLGDLLAGALEQSTVDLASELTTMIESQRSYTANSKVFQTGSEILDVLVNLKR